jgi:hypothetical protein
VASRPRVSARPRYITAEDSCAPEDEEAGPLNYSPLAAMVHADGVGRTFDSARGYRERVGRLLFGLPPRRV